MVRAPCCEKVGLKKGPWTPEEDQILTSYIQNHGHGNWRALPKHAGLLRCGKSCRLRWINYLRPDLKRGNFTREEEDTIIQLHEMLGNRWSTIAAKLSGRTDNEIKNVWHTHLKKRLKQKNDIAVPKCDTKQSDSSTTSNNHTQSASESPANAPIMSPQPSLSDHSSTTDTSTITEETNNIDQIKDEFVNSSKNFPVIDEMFWSEPELVENNSTASSYLDELQPQFPLDYSIDNMGSGYSGYGTNIDDGMDFWYDVFVTSGGIEEFLQFGDAY